MKGLHLRYGQIAWGHSVLDLLDTLPEGAKPGDDFLSEAGALDKYYIPTRYPDAHPAGPAARHYHERDAQGAVSLTREVLDYCERKSLGN